MVCYFVSLSIPERKSDEDIFACGIFICGWLMACKLRLEINTIMIIVDGWHYKDDCDSKKPNSA